VRPKALIEAEIVPPRIGKVAKCDKPRNPCDRASHPELALDPLDRRSDVIDAKAFLGVTVQVAVPDFKAGLHFYTRLFGRAPEFEPYDDFAEWEAVKDVWFQLGEGEPRPTHAARLGSLIFSSSLTVMACVPPSCSIERSVDRRPRFTVKTESKEIPADHRAWFSRRSVWSARPGSFVRTSVPIPRAASGEGRSHISRQMPASRR
jgi:hypothetical protein